MLKDLGIALLVGIPLGLAIFYFGAGQILTAQLMQFQPSLATITEPLTKSLEWLKANPLLTTIGSSLSTFAGSTLLWNKIHKTMKGELKTENLQAQAEAEAEIRKITTEKEQLAGQVEAMNEQAKNVTELTDRVKQIEQERDRLQTQYNEAQTIMKTIRNPDTPELIRRLENEGYSIRKKVP